MTVKELREKRTKYVADARAILDTAETENRVATDDETQRFDAFMSDADKLGKEIERRERIEDAEREMSASRGRKTEDEVRVNRITDDALRGFFLADTLHRPTQAQMQAAQRAGLVGNAFEFNLNKDAMRWNEDFANYETRAQTTQTDSSGGFLVPQGFVNQVEQALLSFGGMRQASSVIRTAGGGDLPYPMVDDSDNEGVIIAENTDFSEEDFTYSSHTFRAYKFGSGIVTVPIELLQDSAIDLNTLIGQQLGERIARRANRAFTVGTGTNEPQGIITGATLGVTAADTAAVTYDELVDLLHSVNSAYRTGAKWMFSDDMLKVIRKIKDPTTGLPIWQPSVANGLPDTLMGYSYIVNDHIATPAAGAKTIVFGALNKYLIRDVLQVQVQRLVERFATANQIGFLAFARSDGALLDAGTHPVAYLQQAAS